MLEILTPLVKLHRVSRAVDPSTFVAAPGIWAALNSDGTLQNITTDTPPTLSKLVVNSASSNPYESNDVESGRVTTIEDIGVRVLVDTEGYTGTPTVGGLLAVSDKAGYEGKLFLYTEHPHSEAGSYEIVARCEEVDAVNSTIVYRTMSPTIVTVS
jgi:hypothetical protein